MWCWIVIPTLVLSSIVPRAVLADDDDKVDGALWQFGMSPVKKGPRSPAPMRGVFRVKGKELFQRSERGKEFDKLIGVKTGFKKRVTFLRIDDLRAVEKDTRTAHTGIKGKLTLEFDDLGEWSGRFVDSEGLQWDFKCKRFQE
jgi:hypothetical protein